MIGMWRALKPCKQSAAWMHSRKVAGSAVANTMLARPASTSGTTAATFLLLTAVARRRFATETLAKSAEQPSPRQPLRRYRINAHYVATKIDIGTLAKYAAGEWHLAPEDVRLDKDSAVFRLKNPAPAESAGGGDGGYSFVVVRRRGAVVIMETQGPGTVRNPEINNIWEFLKHQDVLHRMLDKRQSKELKEDMTLVLNPDRSAWENRGDEEQFSRIDSKRREGTSIHLHAKDMDWEIARICATGLAESLTVRYYGGSAAALEKVVESLHDQQAKGISLQRRRPRLQFISVAAAAALKSVPSFGKNLAAALWPAHAAAHLDHHQLSLDYRGVKAALSEVRELERSIKLSSSRSVVRPENKAVWENRMLQDLWNDLDSAFDLTDRFEELEMKLKYMGEQFKDAIDDNQVEAGSVAEWLIIYLIIIEVIIGLSHTERGGILWEKLLKRVWPIDADHAAASEPTPIKAAAPAVTAGTPQPQQPLRIEIDFPAFSRMLHSGNGEAGAPA